MSEDQPSAFAKGSPGPPSFGSISAKSDSFRNVEYAPPKDAIAIEQEGSVFGSWWRRLSSGGPDRRTSEEVVERLSKRYSNSGFVSQELPPKSPRPVAKSGSGEVGLPKVTLVEVNDRNELDSAQNGDFNDQPKSQGDTKEAVAASTTEEAETETKEPQPQTTDPVAEQGTEMTGSAVYPGKGKTGQTVGQGEGGNDAPVVVEGAENNAVAEEEPAEVAKAPPLVATRIEGVGGSAKESSQSSEKELKKSTTSIGRNSSSQGSFLRRLFTLGLGGQGGGVQEEQEVSKPEKAQEEETIVEAEDSTTIAKEEDPTPTPVVEEPSPAAEEQTTPVVSNRTISELRPEELEEIKNLFVQKMVSESAATGQYSKNRDEFGSNLDFLTDLQIFALTSQSSATLVAVLKEKYGEEDPLVSEWEEAAKSIVVPKVEEESEEESEKTEEVAKDEMVAEEEVTAVPSESQPAEEQTETVPAEDEEPVESQVEKEDQKVVEEPKEDEDQGPPSIPARDESKQFDRQPRCCMCLTPKAK